MSGEVLLGIDWQRRRRRPNDHLRAVRLPLNRSNLVYVRWYLSTLARAYAKLDQFDDAWRCIDEAMTAVETTKERWCEAELNRMAGEIALMAPDPDATKAEAYFERALAVARHAASEVLGTPRRNEPRAALARPRQGAGGARTAGSGLRLVH